MPRMPLNCTLKAGYNRFQAMCILPQLEREREAMGTEKGQQAGNAWVPSPCSAPGIAPEAKADLRGSETPLNPRDRFPFWLKCTRAGLCPCQGNDLNGMSGDSHFWEGITLCPRSASNEACCLDAPSFSSWSIVELRSPH